MRQRLSSFCSDESGLGTIMALFGVIVCLLLTGIAIDSNNAWRSREQLQITADVAAHAGAGVLARGSDPMSAVAVAVGATELNMPAAVYGRLLRDPHEDVVALHYDAARNRLGMHGTVNAVAVRVQRSEATGNPVETFLLKLAGVMFWDVGAVSVAAVVPTQRCNPGDGAFAAGRLRVAGEAAVGPGYCLHGQQGVYLDDVSRFEPGSGISMRDLADCGGRCGNLSNPGIEAAMAEANLVLVDPETHLRRLAEGFADPDRDVPEEGAFFRSRPRALDLEPLAEIGVYTRPLRTGDVVRLTPTQVSRTRALPPGLVYHVSCADAGRERLAITGHGMGFELRDLVLVTDCALDLEATVTLTGTLLISTAEEEMTVMNGALAGDPAGECTAGTATHILTLASQRLPSTFAVSNAAFLSVGDIQVEAHPEGTPVLHHGTAFHAGGSIELKGGHTFAACGAEPAPGVPELRVIRHVNPE